MSERDLAWGLGGPGGFMNEPQEARLPFIRVDPPFLNPLV